MKLVKERKMGYHNLRLVIERKNSSCLWPSLIR